MSAATDTDRIMEKARPEIDKWLAKFPADRRQSAVIPALTAVQEENGGWLTRELMDAVAVLEDTQPGHHRRLAPLRRILGDPPVDLGADLRGEEGLLVHRIGDPDHG